MDNWKNIWVSEVQSGGLLNEYLDDNWRNIWRTITGLFGEALEDHWRNIWRTIIRTFGFLSSILADKPD